MSEVLGFFLLLLLLGFVGAGLYKFRHQIKRWTRDPDYGSTWRPSRRTQLARKIEDANAELEYLDKKETEGTKAETGVK